MKVVHISTMDSGGAANAAYRLHEGLIQAGVQSTFLVLHHDHVTKKVIKFQTPFSDFIFFLLRKIRLKQFGNKFRTTLKKLSSEVEIFSSPRTIYNVAKHPAVKEADIIHLHWIANFVDYSSFFRIKNKSMVWTFHDENSLYGGIHYSNDRSKLSPALIKLENHFKEIKENSLVKSRLIWPICPSPWLFNQTKNSSLKTLFKKATCIYYGIDINQFQFIERQSARQQLGLPIQKRLILLICSNFSVYRKGFDLFCELNKKIEEEDNVKFVLVGETKNLPPLRFVEYLGTVNDPLKLAKLYNAVDATLIPSREDNLPNVMIESLICGTPVLGFRIGGIQDVVKDGFNGLLSTEISSNALYDLVNQFLLAPLCDRHAIRNSAIADFDNKVQVDKVTTLYQECIQYAG
jgi:glycosyltransferase involved in cell wall biosynthesis